MTEVVIVERSEHRQHTSSAGYESHASARMGGPTGTAHTVITGNCAVRREQRLATPNGEEDFVPPPPGRFRGGEGL